MRKMLDLATVDRELSNRFLPVMHMLKPPTYLFSPGILLKVLTTPVPTSNRA